MSEKLSVNMNTAIASVNMVDGAVSSEAALADLPIEAEVTQASGERVEGICAALDKAAQELTKFHEEVFSSHREQIARLSVQIAEKILLKEIGSGKYDISKIIQEALKAAPSGQDVVIRVNPGDLSEYKKIADKADGDILSSVKLSADPGIGPAECVVETDKGMVEYFIEEHLRQVGEALEGKKANG